ncbi:MAG: hypothetical protein Q7J57_07755 [Gemmobacter sp.]|nr:hypothetical protein [Gemmobacter sp.]
MAGRFIAHLGLPKTGTTAIQRWLHARADDLLAHDILSPNAVIAQDGNARNLAFALHHAPGDRTPAMQSLVDGLGQALATGKDVIISAEYFEKVIFRHEMVAQTQASLADLGARWDVGVMFLRNTFDLLNSSFAQNVKVGPFDQDFSGFLKMRRRNRLNEYDRNAANLRAHGTLVRMAAYRSKSGYMTEALMQLADLRKRLPADFDFSTPRSNESIGALGLIVARRVWRLVGADFSEPPAKLRMQMGKIVLQACADLKDRPFNGFSPELQMITEQHYAPVMAAIRQDLTPEDHAELQISRSVAQPLSPQTIADLDAADRQQVRGALDRIAAAVSDDPYLRQTLPHTFASRLAGQKPRQ